MERRVGHGNMDTMGNRLCSVSLGLQLVDGPQEIDSRERQRFGRALFARGEESGGFVSLSRVSLSS